MHKQKLEHRCFEPYITCLTCLNKSSYSGTYDVFDLCKGLDDNLVRIQVDFLLTFRIDEASIL